MVFNLFMVRICGFKFLKIHFILMFLVRTGSTRRVRARARRLLPTDCGHAMWSRGRATAQPLPAHQVPAAGPVGRCQTRAAQPAESARRRTAQRNEVGTAQRRVKNNPE